MRSSRVLFPLALGFVLALAAPVLIGGCSSDSESSTPTAADKDEQSFLQERIQKGFEKRPGKKRAP